MDEDLQYLQSRLKELHESALISSDKVTALEKAVLQDRSRAGVVSAAYTAVERRGRVPDKSTPVNEESLNLGLEGDAHDQEAKLPVSSPLESKSKQNYNGDVQDIGTVNVKT